MTEGDDAMGGTTDDPAPAVEEARIREERMKRRKKFKQLPLDPAEHSFKHMKSISIAYPVTPPYALLPRTRLRVCLRT